MAGVETKIAVRKLCEWERGRRPAVKPAPNNEGRDSNFIPLINRSAKIRNYGKPNKNGRCTTRKPGIIPG